MPNKPNLAIAHPITNVEAPHYNIPNAKPMHFISETAVILPPNAKFK